MTVEIEEDKKIDKFLDDVALTELHTHLGFAISPTMLWEIAHDQGILLPTKDYWEFVEMITIQDSKSYEEYLKMYDWTEKIQSSPEALFLGIQNVVSGAFRKSNIHTIEIRFNPILRNRSKEKDLDHLIVFALQGMERAMLKYPVKAGIILMMDRRFTKKQNEVILNKSIKYKNRGVIGIDLAGPVELNEHSRNFKPRDIADLIQEAKKHGLGVTIHTGEATGSEEMWEVIEELKPDRIGHGIASVNDEKLLKHLAETKIVLETCPISNLNTKLVKNYDELRHIYNTFNKYNIPYTINTDGPEMQLISLRKVFMTLYKEKVLSAENLIKANDIAKNASFIKNA